MEYFKLIHASGKISTSFLSKVTKAQNQNIKYSIMFEEDWKVI
jgi:hypothetical protein